MNEKNLFDFIKLEEGLRLEPYLDTKGNWTVFYGRNINDVPCTPVELMVLLKHGAIEPTAEFFLANDIEEAKRNCRFIFPDFDLFSERRGIALTSIMFNLGSLKFQGFKKMIAAIKARDWKVASNELLDSKREKQLPQRSLREAKMLNDG